MAPSRRRTTGSPKASVVDDGELGVSRIVRGRDLAHSTLVQNVLRTLLELPVPSHRHHFLLLERHLLAACYTGCSLLWQMWAGNAEMVTFIR